MPQLIRPLLEWTTYWWWGNVHFLLPSDLPWKLDEVVKLDHGLPPWIHDVAYGHGVVWTIRSLLLPERVLTPWSRDAVDGHGGAAVWTTSSMIRSLSTLRPFPPMDTYFLHLLFPWRHGGRLRVGQSRTAPGLGRGNSIET